VPKRVSAMSATSERAIRWSDAFPTARHRPP
jgi:hypothetical protein